MREDRRATLYRMVLPDHTCPFGVRAKELLEQNGFEVTWRPFDGVHEIPPPVVAEMERFLFSPPAR